MIKKFLEECMVIAEIIDEARKASSGGPRKDFLTQCRAVDVIEIAKHLSGGNDWTRSVNEVVAAIRPTPKNKQKITDPT